MADEHGPHEHGLGADQSPPDERDYFLAAALEDPELAAALPTTFKLSPSPVLDQGTTPQCVAFSSSGVKAQQDRKDQGAYFDFNEGAFFVQIGGTSNGALIRDAVQRMLAYGYPVVTSGDAAQHKIASYAQAPKTVLDIKAAIATGSPVLIASPWAHSWFHPLSSGVLPAWDYKAGGHAFYAYGWVDGLGFLCRNSWGSAWGPLGGDFYFPYAFAVGTAWEVWKTVDVLEPDPIAYAHIVASTVSGLNIRSVPSTSGTIVATLTLGAQVTTTKLRRYGGAYTVNGITRTDWLGFTRNSVTVWIARGLTKLVS